MQFIIYWIIWIVLLCGKIASFLSMFSLWNTSKQPWFSMCCVLLHKPILEVFKHKEIAKWTKNWNMWIVAPLVIFVPSCHSTALLHKSFNSFLHHRVKKQTVYILTQKASWASLTAAFGNLVGNFILHVYQLVNHITLNSSLYRYCPRPFPL